MEIVSAAVEERAGHGFSHRWVLRVHRKKQRPYVVKIVGNNLRKYCENSSLVGYGYLVEPHRPWIERAIWVILHVSTICMVGMVVRSAYLEYVNVPVVNVVDSDSYPSQKLDFPGIAICNVNRISRKAAMKFANEIVSAKISDWNFVDVLRLIRHLGVLYEETTRPNATAELYLDLMLKKYYNGDYDVTTIMKNLSPTCEDALSSCHFRGKKQNCRELFAFRKTQHGFCCTFNYATQPDDMADLEEMRKNEVRQPHRISSLGSASGLSLVMEPFLEDYYHPILPVKGWKVTVFDARDFPDSVSGSVAETLLSPATETFVELDATSFYSTNEIRSVSIEKRKCIFEDELPFMATGYTYSDCMVDCRAAAIWETCRCRPFYLTRRGDDQYNQRICNTRDSECLYKYREVYWTILSSKLHDSIDHAQPYKLSPETMERCSICHPSCDDVRYYLHSSSTYLNGGIHRTELVDEARLDNQSIVHIYFAKHGSVRLKQEAAYYWYELVSNIGGICGVFVGFSLISVVEFLYFVVCTFVKLWRGEEMTKTSRSRTKRTKETRRIDDELFTGNLYWNEFLPHFRLMKPVGRNQSRRH